MTKGIQRLIIFLLICVGACAQSHGADAIQWRPWSPEIFAEARAQHRFVLLDLQAVWCHWCHVMDDQTYANPAVIALVKSNYIAVRVDQDSRPDLANRYEDYGWPATVVFSGDGGEIVKRQGYIPPGEMIAMLKAIIADPTPGPSVRPAEKINYESGLGLNEEWHDRLLKKLDAGYDTRMAGWGQDQKYLNCDNVEYCLVHASAADGSFKRMARETLDAERQLIDPVWGGVDQYSTDDDWKHPHFEKIMEVQAGNLRIYTLAYLLWHEPKDLRSAQAISDYLENFLTSPEGAFYTSQDADLVDGKHSADYFALGDAARRKKGIPRVDKHIYSRENGWAIDALATLYWATDDPALIRRATQAAEWILANRSLPDGGFRHDAQDAVGPYLGDTLAMARAFLSLYESTADRQWLDHAQSAYQFIVKTFPGQPGFVTAAADPRSPFPPGPQYNENVWMARLGDLLFHYTGKQEFRAAAENALRWISSPEIAGLRYADVGGVLLADEELKTEPAHLTIVGSKKDDAAVSLWHEALKFPAAYRRVELFDSADGPLTNPDVTYPSFPYAAAFVCNNGVCSSPIKNTDVLKKRLAAMMKSE